MKRPQKANGNPRYKRYRCSSEIVRGRSVLTTPVQTALADVAPLGRYRPGARHSRWPLTWHDTSNNAFYCQSQDFIAWDSALMSLGINKVGNAWVYLIIAHEWGHAVQARINRALVSTAAELQADCLAGATLAGAQRNGLIALQPGDNERLGQTLTALADKYPWTTEQSHGDARQRAASFNLGSQHGVTACLAA